MVAESGVGSVTRSGLAVRVDSLPTIAVSVSAASALDAVVAAGETEVAVRLWSTTAVDVDVAFSPHPVVTSSMVSKMNSVQVLSFIAFLLFGVDVAITAECRDENVHPVTLP
jgi:hypothetical protein